MKKIEIVVESTKTGYSAYAKKYPVYTTAKTLEAIKTNVLEALNLHLEKDKKDVVENGVKLLMG